MTLALLTSIRDPFAQTGRMGRSTLPPSKQTEEITMTSTKTETAPVDRVAVARELEQIREQLIEDLVEPGRELEEASEEAWVAEDALARAKLRVQDIRIQVRALRLVADDRGARLEGQLLLSAPPAIAEFGEWLQDTSEKLRELGSSDGMKRDAAAVNAAWSELDNSLPLIGAENELNSRIDELKADIKEVVAAWMPPQEPESDKDAAQTEAYG